MYEHAFVDQKMPPKHLRIYTIFPTTRYEVALFSLLLAEKLIT